jgi:hypothetical protein
MRKYILLLLILLLLTSGCVRSAANATRTPPRAQENPRLSLPLLYIPDNVPSVVGAAVDMPLMFDPSGNQASGVTFSIAFDTFRLEFNPADNNGDGIPDSIRFNTPAEFTRQVIIDPNNTGIIQISINDTQPPRSLLPLGSLLNIAFTSKSTGLAPVAFSQTTPPVVHMQSGQNQDAISDPGSVEISDVASPFKIHYFPVIVKSHGVTAQLTGRITQSGTPVVGVAVTLNFGQPVFTDQDGRYTFTNVFPGSYTVFPGLAGYLFTPLSRTVDVPPGADNLDFTATLVSTNPPAVQPTVPPTVPTAAPPIPTATSSGVPQCQEIIVDGKFDSVYGWVIPDTAFDASYNALLFRSPLWSLRTGITNDWENVPSVSWAYQTVSIPQGIRSAKLSAWMYLTTGEAGVTSSSDRQSVKLLDEAMVPLTELFPSQLTNRPEWAFYEFDLTPYSGRKVNVAFETINDGVGSVTAMYVDDVSLLTCK